MKAKVKICGITRLEDARAALELGADELGFVLAPSPRRVEPEAVRGILAELRSDGSPSGFRAVGVFVNETPGAMRDIIAFAGLDVAQIHGDETPSACASFVFPWYRALRIGSVADALRLADAGWDCPPLLVDSAAPGSYGGSGRGIGVWAALAARALTRAAGKEYVIAGGIKARNVASVIHSLSPDGIDVSSGVEEAPGRKSRAKLEALFREIDSAYDAIAYEANAYQANAREARAEEAPNAAR